MYVYLLLKNKISTLKILWLRVTQYVIGSDISNHRGA